MKKLLALTLGLLLAVQIVSGQSKIAVLDAYLGEGVHSNASAIVADTLSEQFVKSTDFITIDRAYVSSIQEEKKLQLSGEVNVEDIKELGVIFGAEFLCIANVSLLGSTYTISARLIDVETAQIVSQESARMQGQIEVLFDIAEMVGNKLIGKEPGVIPDQSYQPDQPALDFAFDPGWLNSIEFLNETGNDIEYVFMSPGDSEYWGPEILGPDRVLESWDNLGFYIFYPDECNDFDILAIDSNDNSLYIYDYTICDGTEETIAFSKRDMAEEESYFDFMTLDIYNEIETEIFYLFVSPADSNMYGVDLLDEYTTILPGEYLSLLIPIGEDEVDYDVMAVDEYNNTYSFTYTISIEYGYEQVVAVEMSDID
ncbi:MAG: hypothetical protein KAR21_14860 [Spirochaetales bacterium]|nr:hypothetical protein [Spirochaetales bacterium]